MNKYLLEFLQALLILFLIPQSIIKKFTDRKEVIIIVYGIGLVVIVLWIGSFT